MSADRPSEDGSTSKLPLLRVRDLEVSLQAKRARNVEVVRGVTFDVERGQRVAIVGESGSGKTMTALALMRLLAPPARVRGEIVLEGRDVLAMRAKEISAVRGREMAMVFQNPMSSLNPLQTIGAQIIEAIQAHSAASNDDAQRRATEVLEEVGIAQAQVRFSDYPHQLSGGMRQRVMIAMAIAGDPKLLIADEITSALDVTTQARIIELLARVVDRHNMAVIVITHDLALAASFCDQIEVMYAGRLVERSSAAQFVRAPVHPYSAALQQSMCDLDADVDRPLPAIPGQPPLPWSLPTGCTFHPRCAYAEAICRAERPPAYRVGPSGGILAECHFARERYSDSVAFLAPDAELGSAVDE